MKQTILLFIFIYQKYLSRIKPRTCRFYPTCSQYMDQAIRYFGLKKGVALGLKRVFRCHPYHQGGYDPVPGKIIQNRKGRI